MCEFSTAKKNTSLLRYGINYSRKSIIAQAPGDLQGRKNRVTLLQRQVMEQHTRKHKQLLENQNFLLFRDNRGPIFSHVQPFYECAVSDLDRSMHISLWILVAHSSFLEESHTTKNSWF